VKTVKAPRTSVSRSAASIPVLILLGTLSGTALAATDIQEPCPEAADSAGALRALIPGKDAAAPLIRTVDGAETAAPARATKSDADSASVRDQSDTTAATDASIPAYTTRLPGVSASDMPGFRRHMYRTDI
jgi:hypothetical protein